MIRNSLLPAIVIAVFPFGYSQIPHLQDYVDHALGGLPELAQMIDSPTLTTGIDDAVFGFPLLDDYDPSAIEPLGDLPRSQDGSFLLREGVFEGEVHSYCLKPGTYGPSGGDGYLYGPVTGPYADIVQTVLRESVRHPDISHGDIQMLLWAAVTRAGLKKTPPHLQWVAAQLLSSEQVFRLNGGALALVPENTLDKALGRFPGTMRKVLQTEARMRAMLTGSDLDYDALERVAVLTGAPPILAGKRKVPRTRWSLHPGGYLVRYIPKAASRTLVQVWVPRQVRVRLDHLGQIESLQDNFGNQLIFEYRDTASSLPTPSSSDLRGAELQRVRWSRFNQGNRTTVTCTLHENSGWTWYRKPTRSASHGSVRTQALSGTWEMRYQDAKEREREVEEFLARTSRDSLRSPSSLQDVLNTVHLRETLGAQLRGGDPAVYIGFELLSQSLAAAIGHHLVKSTQFSPIHSLEFDPAGQVAVPANTGRQRLGLSARLY